MTGCLSGPPMSHMAATRALKKICKPQITSALSFFFTYVECHANAQNRGVQIQSSQAGLLHVLVYSCGNYHVLSILKFCIDPANEIPLNPGVLNQRLSQNMQVICP